MEKDKDEFKGIPRWISSREISRLFHARMGRDIILLGILGVYSRELIYMTDAYNGASLMLT